MLCVLPRDCCLGAVVPVDVGLRRILIIGAMYPVADGTYMVETVLYDVPSVVAVVSGFYCRRMDYGVLVVGGVSWELCRVLCRACLYGCLFRTVRW